MKLILSIFLLATAAKLVTSQSESAFCLPDNALTTAAAPDSLAIPPPPLRCEDGPLRTIHTVPNEFYWPPIYKGSCDKLKCKDPPCIARKTVWRYRCVLVYKIVNGCWRRVGFRRIRYLDHLSCSCKECSDIKSARECVNTYPCPNSNKPNSFCFYKPGKCDCCVPYPCPPGQVFDKKTCSCQCPPGSNKVGNKCVGDCDDINLNYCKFVLCDLNQQFYCAVKNHKCVCPSCDAEESASKCPRTRCVEQRNNPYCVYDFYKRECRCPECKDIRDRHQCINSYCGHIKCRYNTYTNKCFCPTYEDGGDKK